MGVGCLAAGSLRWQANSVVVRQVAFSPTVRVHARLFSAHSCVGFSPKANRTIHMTTAPSSLFSPVSLPMVVVLKTSWFSPGNVAVSTASFVCSLPFSVPLASGCLRESLFTMFAAQSTQKHSCYCVCVFLRHPCFDCPRRLVINGTRSTKWRPG